MLVCLLLHRLRFTKPALLHIRCISRESTHSPFGFREAITKVLLEDTIWRSMLMEYKSFISTGSCLALHISDILFKSMILLSLKPFTRGDFWQLVTFGQISEQIANSVVTNVW